MRLKEGLPGFDRQIKGAVVLEIRRFGVVGQSLRRGLGFRGCIGWLRLYGTGLLGDELPATAHPDSDCDPDETDPSAGPHESDPDH
jgi:hypothetical protein